MSKQEKIQARITAKPVPTDIKWSELSGFLKQLDYTEMKGNGSRRKFIHNESKHVICLHEPHPEPNVKQCYIRQVVDTLRSLGRI